METSTIEVNVGGHCYQVAAAVCPKCLSKIYPADTLAAHEASHITLEPESKDIMCKRCHKVFSQSKVSGPPYPTICPLCRADKIDYAARRKKNLN